MKGVKYPKQWDEEWFLSWTSRRKNDGHKPRQSTQDGLPVEWGQDKSVGTIHTIRHRLGERMSKVHHDHTSYLFRSKWRKKYCPKGIAR
jgi:hypothetical protein